MAGRRRALIVANGEYENAGLQQLASPAADADALAGVLADRAVSDFEVRVVRNEASHVVQGEIEDLCADGRPDDVLLLHFSCHGLKDDSGGLYFAARNTRPDRLRSTAVPADFVQQCIRQSRSRSIVLLLDCCYGGAFGEGVAVRASGDANVLDSFRGGRGRAVITASNSIEYAFEGARLASDEPASPSVFTSALVEGLRTGEADRDEDGWIALGELYEYLFDRVRERNPKQTPSRDIEMQGELYLAKSRRRRIKPSPIPADLSAAVAAENPFTRLGAVAELRRRLSSDNLPVAMGAFEALKTMAATDIEHVAAAASDAMGFAVVRAEVSEVSFGPETSSRRIRLLGPPVARACTFEASHAWIEVREAPGGAEVSVTPGPERRQGKVVVTGPTGETVVAVESAANPAAVTTDPVEVPESAAPETSAPGPAAAPEPTEAPDPAAVLGEAPGAGTVEATAPDGPESAETPPRPAERGTATSGLLLLAGGVAALASMAFEFHYSLGQYSSTLAGAWPGLEWYVWLLGSLAIVAGGCLAVSRVRTRIGVGWSAGIGAAALWGLLTVYDLEKSFTRSEGMHPAAGFGFLFAGLLAVLAGGIGAVWLVRRRLRFRRPGWPSWTALGLGPLGAAALLVQYSAASSADSSRYDGAWRAFVFLVVLSIAVPVLAALFVPGRFGGRMLVGWAAGALPAVVTIAALKPDSNSVNVTGLILYALSLALLGAVGVAMLRRNQPIERQP